MGECERKRPLGRSTGRLKDDDDDDDDDNNNNNNNNNMDLQELG